MPSSNSSTYLEHKKEKVGELTDEPGVYALCDLDAKPVYVGQGISSDRGIRQRVQRHLTSARSDMVANRGIDVWDIAYVRTWPITESYQNTEEKKDLADQLEVDVFEMLSEDHTIHNYQEVDGQPTAGFDRTHSQMVQIIGDTEIEKRSQPRERMLRQLQHLHRLADHMVYVKSSEAQQRALKRHLDRAENLCKRVLDI